MLSPHARAALTHEPLMAAVAEASMCVAKRCSGPLFDKKLLILIGAFGADSRDITPEWAVEHGHLELLQTFQLEDMEELLIIAATNGHLHIARWLLDMGANAENIDVDEVLPFSPSEDVRGIGVLELLVENGVLMYDIVHYAAAKGCIDVLRHFLPRISHMGNSLCGAAAAGQLESVVILVEAGADINFVFPQSPLVEAVKNNHPSVAKYLIDAGADVHEAYDGAFHAAARGGSVEMINMLVAAATKDVPFGQLIKVAAQYGHIDLVRGMMDKCADGHQEDALISATNAGHVEIVEFLESAGLTLDTFAECEFEDVIKLGHTSMLRHMIDMGFPLERGSIVLAAKHGELYALQLMMEPFVAVARVNEMIASQCMPGWNIIMQRYDCRTVILLALDAAIKNGRANVVEYLLELDGTIRLGPADLLNAIRRKSVETARVLIEHGVDAQEQSFENLCFATNVYSLAMMRLLVQHIDMGSLSAKQQGVLLSQAAQYSLEAVIFLVVRGVRADADESVALREAARDCDASIVQYLIHMGADVHARDDGPLVNAVLSMEDPHDTIEILIAAGADVRCRGGTLLLTAISADCADALCLLVKAGADVHMGDEAALKYAVSQEESWLIEIMLDAGATITDEVRWMAAALGVALPVRQ